MKSALSTNPIHRWIKSAKGKVTELIYTTNLEHLYHEFLSDLASDIETINLHICPPWWEPSVKTHIEQCNKEEAWNRHHAWLRQIEVPNVIIIYMNGSGINEWIGMATYSSMLHKIDRYHLWTEKEFNMYAAELKAIHIAIKTAQDTIHQFNQCMIFSDSQAAIISIFKPYWQLGLWQYLIENILNKVNHIQETCLQYCLNIEWVPEYERIAENEKADEAAKDVATRRIGMRDSMKGIKAVWN